MHALRCALSCPSTQAVLWVVGVIVVAAAACSRTAPAPSAVPSTQARSPHVRVHPPAFDFEVPSGFAAEPAKFFSADDPQEDILAIDCSEQGRSALMDPAMREVPPTKARIGPWPAQKYTAQRLRLVASTERGQLVVSILPPFEPPLMINPSGERSPWSRAVDPLLASFAWPDQPRSAPPDGWMRHSVRCGRGRMELDLPTWVVPANTASVSRQKSDGNESLGFVQFEVGVLGAGETARGGSALEFKPCVTPDGRPAPQRHFPIVLDGEATKLAWCVHGWPRWTNLDGAITLDDGRRVTLQVYAGPLHGDDDLVELVQMARDWAKTIRVPPVR